MGCEDTGKLMHQHGIILLINFLPKYREWIYSVLTPEERKTKRIEYYTPIEIEGWMYENPGVYINPCVDYSWNYTCEVCQYPT